MPKDALPPGYQPFDELVVCSNTLRHGIVPIEIEGHYPFLVGKGLMPLVWLASPMGGNKWQYVIAANKRCEDATPSFKNFLLGIHEITEQKQIDIGLWKMPVLSVHKESDARAVVTLLDLRPLQLAIHGDTTGLIVGTTNMKGNSFDNVGTMIAIGTSP